MQHSRIACLHTLYSCLRRVYAKFRKPLSALFSPSPSSVALSYNPAEKKETRKVAIQSLTLNQFLGERKKTITPWRESYPVHRVVYIAAYDRKSYKRRSKICCYFFFIYIYIYNCPFVHFSSYNFFNDAFMTRYTIRTRLLSRKVWKKKQSFPLIFVPREIIPIISYM